MTMKYIQNTEEKVPVDLEIYLAKRYFKNIRKIKTFSNEQKLTSLPIASY